MDYSGIARADAPLRQPELGVSTHAHHETGLVVAIAEFPLQAQVLEQWRGLGRNALVPNLFYEADFAQAAAHAFGKGVKVALFFTSDGELVFAWPFLISSKRWGLPLRAMIGWHHNFSALGVPLIHRDHDSAALRCFLALPRIVPGLPRRVWLPLVPDTGAFSEPLKNHCAQLGLRTALFECHARAMWQRGERDDPLNTLSAGSRSKLRQEYRRLEKDGTIVFETLNKVIDILPALEEYFELEATGWKGRIGTAIPQSAAEAMFMRNAVKAYAEQERLRIHRLRIGETTIASSITYITGDHAWYTKISFNDRYARNSPGSQLVLKVTEAFRRGEAQSADSCAPPGHPLMARFWPLRFGLSNVLLELESRHNLYVLTVQLEKLRLLARQLNRSRREYMGRWVRSYGGAKT
ncbi:CelD/BcsL family acetyltransferase involved in cellulose biosynthesis [Pseudorhizobium tarimense]|uniref:CelD/BcsL family acetyltransferase involved in cellulose biosynthesis n=1 Tax=Pseudorhizobium tarimense TaxID=1079109 RepID=A0ABV2HCH2_9HYPH|nr:GNAT family N-acetyltransferase [Pseudorhizobium tarimense]MCJ8520955.1 GNAT family N-acetyltransferase [Pseudorhizobium tarimense]